MDTSSYVWVKPKRRRPPHPTAVKLLEITVDLLDEIPIDALSIAAVLERSGVSHGSLYHHYADFPDLVEQADCYAELQQRGWVRNGLDPMAMSALVQAVILGRVVDDISEHPLHPELWTKAAVRAIAAVLFPD